jgi:hypothetical protein
MTYTTTIIHILYYKKYFIKPFIIKMTLKDKCKTSQVLNPSSGRCVTKTGRVGQKIMASRKSPCPNNKIYNPSTGRCVLKTGVIGKALLAKRSRGIRSTKPKVRGSRGSCGKGRYLNSVTKRCRNVPKAVNETSIKNRGTKKKVFGDMKTGAPIKVSKLLDNCELTKKWTTKGKIGTGSVGSIYMTCKGDDCSYVLKVQKDDAEFRNEVSIMKRLKGWKHAPKVHAMWTCKGTGYIVEEKLLPLVSNKKHNYTQLKKILNKLHSKRIVFPDCHDGNTMRRADGTVVLIDFGWAAYFKTETTTIWEPIWLSDSIDRKVDMEDMIAWETVNLADEFGPVKDQKIAAVKFEEICQK